VVKNKCKTPVAVKVEFMEWFISRDPRKGTQGNWAKEHDLAAETISRWLHNDDEFKSLLDAAERGQEQRWVQVVETMYLRATDPEDSMGVQAAAFLAKIYGKFKGDKLEITTVQRVAYTQPSALKTLSDQIDAERPN